MANKIGITLDPGHAKNYNQGANKAYYESNAVYDFSLQLQGELEKYGIFTVYNTKSKLDCNPGLTTRGKTAINNKSRMFISLHTNAATPTAYRTEIFNSVKRPGSAKFLSKMGIDIANVFTAKISQGKFNGVSAKPGTSNPSADYYSVLYAATSSDVVQHVFLIEFEFHSNPKACEALLRDDVWAELAKVVASDVYEEMKQYYVPDDTKFISATTKDSVNVRSLPSTSSQKIGSLAKGASIKLISSVDGWYKFLWNGAAAWVSANYVNKPSATVPADGTVDLPPVSSSITTPPATGSTTTNTVNDPLVTYGLLAPSASAITGKITASTLNVRSGPGTSYAVLDTLPSGTTVAIAQKNPNSTSTASLGDWIYVQYSKGTSVATGFVSASYVSQLTAETAKKAQVKVNTVLNYREGPGTTYKVAGTLPNCAVVYTLGTAGDGSWMKIRLAENATTDYFASAQYLVEMVSQTESGAASSTDSTATESTITVYRDCDYGKVTAALNVRSGPSDKYTKIGQFSAGAIVCIVSFVEDMNWAKVIYGTFYGYVSTKYLDIVSKNMNTAIETEIPAAIKSVVEDRIQMNAEEWFLKILGARVSSDYGYRVNPITGEKGQFHRGIDFACSAGTPIYSDVDGIVSYNGYDPSGGNMVFLIDEMGRQHRFLHMREKGAVTVGTFITVGTLIGYVGSTGDSTGNHLHYEVRLAPWTTNDSVNPDTISFQ